MRECIYGEVVVETHDCCGIIIETVKMGDRREEIVRCRDCKHAYGNGMIFTYFATLNEDDLDITPSAVEPDDFCAWGVGR